MYILYTEELELDIRVEIFIFIPLPCSFVRHGIYLQQKDMAKIVYLQVYQIFYGLRKYFLYFKHKVPQPSKFKPKAQVCLSDMY